MLFFWIFENNGPGGGVLARFFCSKGGGFALSLWPEGGNSPFQKIPRGFARGGWSGLELTDTLSKMA